MKMEYRVCWQRDTGWADEGNGPIYGDVKHRLYQQRWAAERFLGWMSTLCGRCPSCAPELHTNPSWYLSPPCKAFGAVAWIEEREVGEWREAG